MSNIICTGSSGFVGSHLVPFLEKKHQVVRWDIKEGRDIFDDEIVKTIKNVDVVIHLAALTNVTESFDKPQDYYHTNVLGTARILRLCAENHTKMIYPSSAAIYHRELSPYAESKALAEDLVQKFLEVPAVVLRFFNIYGARANADSGSIMYRFLHDDPIVIYGDGEQTRDYISIEDLVKIVEAAMQSEWDGQVLDVGTGQKYSANYVAGLFAHHRGVKVEYEPPKREIKWSSADVSKLKTLYKEHLETDLSSDIKRMINENS